MASYNEQAFQTFQNALIYTVCAEIVHTLVDDSNATTLTVLIVVFAALIKLSAAGLAAYHEYETNAKRRATVTATHMFALTTFLWQSLHNVLVQFTSTLIARVAIKVLPPHDGNTTWILGLTLMSLTLLWLLNESIKPPAP